MSSEGRRWRSGTPEAVAMSGKLGIGITWHAVCAGYGTVGCIGDREECGAEELPLTREPEIKSEQDVVDLLHSLGWKQVERVGWVCGACFANEEMLPLLIRYFDERP
ncbi:MAG: hypothetical protein NXI30_04455 [bacterium]|nr:hypothetical protein [bacterium]